MKITGRPDMIRAAKTAGSAGSIGGVFVGLPGPGTGGGSGIVSSTSNTASWQPIVSTITANGSTVVLGPNVNLAAASNITLAVASNTVTIIGPSFGSNSNSVSTANAPGASPAMSRADHVHLGVTSLAHTSNTFSGPVTLAAGANVGITSPAAGTYRIDVNSATGGASGGAASIPPWALMPYLGASHGMFEALPGANNAIYVPAAPLMVAVTITGIRLRVGTSSGNISVGLYDENGTRVATSGAVACPAAGHANVAFTASYSAPPGRYYLGISCDNTTATFSKPIVTFGPPAVARQQTSAHPLPASIGTTADNVAAVNLIGRLTDGFP